MNETEPLAAAPAGPNAALAQYSQAGRLLRLHTPLGADRLLPEQFSGQESLSDGGFRFEVTALSIDAHLDLNALLGQPVLIELLTQQSRGQLRPFHGHVTRFALLGAEGGFARYRLTIEPWLAFLRHRQDSYVFQDQSVIEIVEELFGDYMGQGKLDPAWRCELADAAAYPKRSLCIQYEESDFAFVERLLAEEGLFYWFEHSGDAAAVPFGRHTLIIADHNGAFKANAQPNIQFLRADATESEDTLQRWHGARKLQTSRIELASWDYRSVSARPVSMASDSNAQPLELSAADHPGPYAYNDSADGERYAALHLQALAARNKTYSAEGTVRTLAPGTTFTLSGHAEHDRDRQAQGDEAARFAVLSVEHQARNNLSSELRTGIEPLPGSALAAAAAKSHAPLYRNRLQAIRADIAYRPLGEDEHGLRIHPKPTAAGTQTAIVVGVDGAPLTTERDHRIKVQFHWQRGAKGHHRMAHPSDMDNAPANETSGTWVRVATPLAGANWGGVFIPRIGQEVLVAFMEGDIDRPVIIGALYNGRGQDNAQANQVNAGAGSASANAPAWFAGSGGAHAHNAVLSGIKTQALPTSQSGAGGYNQLVFDDTPGQSRTSLATTQAGTQLNLGHLKHQSDNARKADRGHGAELVTSAYGAIRAGSGLLLSTDGRANATSSQLDSREAQAQLTQAQQLVQTLTTTAQQHQAKLPGEPGAEQVPVIEQLSHTLAVLQSTAGAAATDSGDSQSIGGQGQVPAWSEPMLLLSSPAGIAALTPAEAVLAGGNTLSLTAQDINLMAQANSVTAVKAGIGLFTYGKAQSSAKPNQEVGLKLHAASGQVSLEAHSDAIKATADKTVTIASTTQSVQVGAPEHVLLTAGGAYVRLSGGNIEIHAPGAVSFKASQKNWTGPQSASTPTLNFPRSDLIIDFKKAAKYPISL